MENGSIMDDILHITVGVAPNGKLDLTNELRLLKAALLYADKVKLCSLTSQMAILLPFLGVLSDDDLLDLSLHTATILNKDPEAFDATIKEYKLLKNKKRRNKNEILRFMHIKRQLDKTREEFKKVAERLLKEAKADGLFPALQSGLVDIQWFDINKENVAEDYIYTVLDAILTSKTYPLLDDFSGNLIKLALEVGKIIPLRTTITKAKQASLSSGLFDKLPLFDEASVDEIIDIRKELEKPLIRFRSAIISFSRNIENEPWNAEFRSEVDQIFLEKVEPAILDIEEAYKENNLLVKLLKRGIDKPLILPGSTAFGFFLSKATNFPDLINLALGISVGTLAIGFDAFKEWQDKNREIEKNQLYFYYKVKRSLEM